MNEHKDFLGSWSDIRTAYHVARLGTLSAAAAYLGIHHATAIRHIDALEKKLDCKLFYRNPRGYVPSQAGQDLLRTAGATEDQFMQMVSRLHGQNDKVSGELVVTTLSGLSKILTPYLVAFQRNHPAVNISLIADERLLKLEYGEAHVAIRAGKKPEEPDNVVQKFISVSSALYAHKSYVESYGRLKPGQWHKHKFVMGEHQSRQGPFAAWARAHVPAGSVTFRAAEMRSREDAILAGAGIGFLMSHSAASNPDLVEMMPPIPELESPLWLVTHVDQHHTAKVRAFLAFIKENWVCR